MCGHHFFIHTYMYTYATAVHSSLERNAEKISSAYRAEKYLTKEIVFYLCIHSLKIENNCPVTSKSLAPSKPRNKLLDNEPEKSVKAEKQPDQRRNSAPQLFIADSKGARGNQQRILSREAPEQGDRFYLCIHSHKIENICLVTSKSLAPSKPRNQQLDNEPISSDKAEKQPDQRRSSAPQLFIADSKGARESQQRIPSREGPGQGDRFYSCSH